MEAEKKILGSDDAWENGELGNSEANTVPLSDAKQREMDVAINDSLGLCPISIRLERSLIEDFKNIATINKLGYQTLMRQALKRFAECEKKRLIGQMAAEVEARLEAEKKPQPKQTTAEKPKAKSQNEAEPKQRKAA